MCLTATMAAAPLAGRARRWLQDGGARPDVLDGLRKAPVVGGGTFIMYGVRLKLAVRVRGTAFGFCFHWQR